MPLNYHAKTTMLLLSANRLSNPELAQTATSPTGMCEVGLVSRATALKRLNSMLERYVKEEVIEDAMVVLLITCAPTKKSLSLY